MICYTERLRFDDEGWLKECKKHTWLAPFYERIHLVFLILQDLKLTRRQPQQPQPAKLLSHSADATPSCLLSLCHSHPPPIFSRLQFFPEISPLHSQVLFSTRKLMTPEFLADIKVDSI
ncbi:hypothetical protein CMV_023701 [Castanea mollissima]|uniref:Uncharacterized protein n=1 Tax=Castanea mollissima TaxID=60419 RepID=A0A8J4VJ28_9ROSI|nr:hypothetical protein CMV_023701 [Castanea mollissima]